MSTSAASPRNPGPSWGAAFLNWADHRIPRWIFRPGLMAGTWVAVACMPGQRRHSRDYLAAALERRPALTDVWRNFLAFADSMLMNLRAGRGEPVRCVMVPETAAEFEALVASGEAALYGTFHFGASDLLGYALSDRGRQVSMLRLRVNNSEDTHLLGRRFAENVSFLWVNEPTEMLFALKSAIEAGRSVAMKCDRLEFSARSEAFQFLGARRLFPFTIYHLAILFGRPVVFCTAVEDPTTRDLSIFASPVFRVDPSLGKEPNLKAAKDHFQAVLTQLESLVRQRPELWFNFLPLNPPAAETQP